MEGGEEASGDETAAEKAAIMRDIQKLVHKQPKREGLATCTYTFNELKRFGLECLVDPEMDLEGQVYMIRVEKRNGHTDISKGQKAQWAEK